MIELRELQRLWSLSQGKHSTIAVIEHQPDAVHSHVPAQKSIRINTAATGEKIVQFALLRQCGGTIEYLLAILREQPAGQNRSILQRQLDIAVEADLKAMLKHRFDDKIERRHRQQRDHQNRQYELGTDGFHQRLSLAFESCADDVCGLKRAHEPR